MGEFPSKFRGKWWKNHNFFHPDATVDSDNSHFSLQKEIRHPVGS
jgi:hypothetical protein